MCHLPMGMQSGKIRNQQLTASSSLGKYFGPYLARLHRTSVKGGYRTAWSAGVSNIYQWIRVDFGKPAKIVRVSTQGRANYDQWMTSFWLSYSLDFLHYVYYKYQSKIKVSPARKSVSIKLKRMFAKLKIRCDLCLVHTALQKVQMFS